MEGRCTIDDLCLILGVDFDRDGALEHCILEGDDGWYTACYAARPGGIWVRIGSLAYRGASPRPSREALEAGLGPEPAKIRPSPYDDVVVPGGVLELVPPSPSARID